ncbi:alpha,alpha-trehalose-phosphate synthase [UDP-forming] 1-like protein [Tanacetum coccineum]
MVTFHDMINETFYWLQLERILRESVPMRALFSYRGPNIQDCRLFLQRRVFSHGQLYVACFKSQDEKIKGVVVCVMRQFEKSDVLSLADPVAMSHVRDEIAPSILLVVDFGGWASAARDGWEKPDGELFTQRLLVVANRLPVSAVRRGEESWSLEVSGGGLVSALLGVKEVEAKWIGWAGVNVLDEPGQRALTKALAKMGKLYMLLLGTTALILDSVVNKADNILYLGLKDCNVLLQQGNHNRTTEPTRDNETSSRSHAILQVGL